MNGKVSRDNGAAMGQGHRSVARGMNSDQAIDDVGHPFAAPVSSNQINGQTRGLSGAEREKAATAPKDRPSFFDSLRTARKAFFESRGQTYTPSKDGRDIDFG